MLSLSASSKNPPSLESTLLNSSSESIWGGVVADVCGVAGRSRVFGAVVVVLAVSFFAVFVSGFLLLVSALWTSVIAAALRLRVIGGVVAAGGAESRR